MRGTKCVPCVTAGRRLHFGRAVYSPGFGEALTTPRSHPSQSARFLHPGETCRPLTPNTKPTALLHCIMESWLLVEPLNILQQAQCGSSGGHCRDSVCACAPLQHHRRWQPERAKRFGDRWRTLYPGLPTRVLRMLSRACSYSSYRGTNPPSWTQKIRYKRQSEQKCCPPVRSADEGPKPPRGCGCGCEAAAAVAPW